MIQFLYQAIKGLDNKGKGYLINCSLMTFVASIFVIMQPLFLTAIVDSLDDNTRFLKLLCAVIIAHIISRFTNEARWFFIGYPEMQLIKFMRMKYINQVLLKSPHFFKINPIGGFINKLSQIDGALYTISRNMFFVVIPLMMNIVILLCVVYRCFSISYFSVLVISFTLYLIVLFKGSDYLDEKFKSSIESHSKSASLLSDLLFNRTLLRFYNFEQHESAKYHESLKEYCAEALKSIFRRGYFGVIQSLVMLIAIITTVILSAQDLLSHAMTVGKFILINTYILQLLSPLESLSKLYRDIKSSLVAMNVLESDISSFDDMKFGNQLIDISHGVEIEFKNVSFKYPGSEEFALKNVSFKIPAYSFVGIVGKSGSGKSTLTALISRLYEPTEGTILFNDIYIDELSRESLHACFANISQNTQILSDTLYNNLLMGQKDADLQSAVCNSFRIDDFVKLLPKKYETNISLHDKMLSEGQLQRISLARGIIANKPILVLDEVTSSIDSITEQYLLNALQTLIKSRTIMFIAHKLDIMPKTDFILVFDNGKLVESGTHEELLEKQSYYKQLWSAIVNFQPVSIGMRSRCVQIST